MPAHRSGAASAALKLSGMAASASTGEHVLLVAPVVADSADLEVAAIAKVAATAFRTGVVLSAVPTNTDTLSLTPARNAGPQGIDHPGHFMTGNSGVADARPVTFLDQHVAVAYPAGLHLDAHVARAGLGNLPLDDLKVRSRRGNLHHLHRCRGTLVRCHELPPPRCARIGLSPD